MLDLRVCDCYEHVTIHLAHCCIDNSSKQYVTTRDGNLIIYTEAVKTHYIENGEHRVKNYTSGMVQSWNKFCFTGGTLEMSIELPGGSDAGGSNVRHSLFYRLHV